MTWQRICRTEEVQPPYPLARVISNTGHARDHVCVVARDDGSYAAMLDRCPHRNIALSGGVVADGALVCPGHFWRFSLEAGHRIDLPEYSATLYPTRVIDGWVEAQIPAAPEQVSLRQWLLEQARAHQDH